jgi:septal ring factor EnvC (AmiA/AmiB activator)
MPDVRGECMVEVAVEVYCAECGEGLCGGTETKKDSELHVALCPRCKGRWQADIYALDAEIKDKTNEIDNLRSEIKELNREIERLSQD